MHHAGHYTTEFFSIFDWSANILVIVIVLQILIGRLYFFYLFMS